LADENPGFATCQGGTRGRGKLLRSAQGGLGWRFWTEVDQCILWIAQNPTVPRLRAGRYHRVNLKNFPYYVAYIVRPNAIWILAIASARTLPEYWIGRLNELE
jgi:hypothetical protein